MAPATIPVLTRRGLPASGAGPRWPKCLLVTTFDLAASHRCRRTCGGRLSGAFTMDMPAQTTPVPFDCDSACGQLPRSLKHGVQHVLGQASREGVVWADIIARAHFLYGVLANPDLGGWRQPDSHVDNQVPTTRVNRRYRGSPGGLRDGRDLWFSRSREPRGASLCLFPGTPGRLLRLRLVQHPRSLPPQPTPPVTRLP